MVALVHQLNALDFSHVNGYTAMYIRASFECLIATTTDCKFDVVLKYICPHGSEELSYSGTSLRGKDVNRLKIGLYPGEIFVVRKCVEVVLLKPLDNIARVYLYHSIAVSLFDQEIPPLEIRLRVSLIWM